jgi:heme oxygenase
MDPGLTREAYLRVLERLQPIIATWETYLALAPGLPDGSFRSERNRLPLLVQDLEFLRGSGGRAADEQACVLPVLDGNAQWMGAMYVMEGSRLGGQLIARHVEETLSLAPGEATRYFRGFGDRTGPMWKEFVQRLQQDVPDGETEEAILGAKKMFATFGAWMRGESASIEELAG